MPKHFAEKRLTFKGIFSRLAKKFYYEASFSKGEDRVTLRQNGFPLSIDCVKTGVNSIFVSLFIRTTSWDFDGERTDLHDCLSILICCFLRINTPRTSSRVWDIPHPAVEVSEVEIYARYITFEQPFGSIFTIDEEGCKNLFDVLSNIQFAKLLLPRMLSHTGVASGHEDLQLYDFEGVTISKWARLVAEALKRPIELGNHQYNLRRNPCWLYYRSIRPTISIIRSPRLAIGLRCLMESAKPHPWKTLEAKHGVLFVSQETRNFVGFQLQKRANRILQSLHDSFPEKHAPAIPIDNYCIFVGKDNLIVMETDSSRVPFEKEREILRKRHQLENALLFPPSKIIWRKKIPGAEFEALVHDLLMREPDVRWIRKAGHTNEPDGGRDLIAEWDTRPKPGQILDEGRSPVVRRRVIVQCKAFQSSVGKSKVTDIYDLLKRHQASGFFLAVTSHVTNGLIGHLEKMRYENDLWSDWWTRAEIEERLARNEDIAVKYPTVVTLKRKCDAKC